MSRRNPYPGVPRSPSIDRHGKPRWRLRKTVAGRKIDTYLPGPYGTPAFVAAYEEALEGARQSKAPRAPHGTVAWVMKSYLGSLKFQNLSNSRKRTIRHELDWLKGIAGKYQISRLGVQHVEAIMAKKSGPAAANAVKKNLSMLFNFASKKLGYTGSNPARHAERMKTNPDGYHTWTDDEVARFLDRHGPGSKARLVMLLALNTGMARQDLTRVGRQSVRVKDGRRRIDYRRGKTSVAADLPILPELEEELRQVASESLLFVTHGRDHRPYKPETLGNWFRARCKEAGVPGALHGLRKAGATRLANAGATEWEIASYLAHKDTKQAAIYAAKANRSRLADSGFSKLSAASVSNLSTKLDKGGS